MRHGKKFNHLGRKSAHRKATLRNMVIALITHKRINTTVAKAKALRVFAEPLITKAKTNDMHNRRVVFSYLQNNDATGELFGAIAAKVGDRPGGYLRIIKTGFRLGDGAETAMIEFVDFNEVYNKDSDKKSGRTRRSRRGGGSSSAAAPAAAAAAPAAPAAAEEE
ncbi:50S ribosomal protein L17 [Neolewinella persica]|uniref:50S ribosomal protein L17 n=1 Tax=Neolewinella persica TaxID=70998 RepID=UPI00037ECC28